MLAGLWADLAGARIHLRVDIGSGDAITAAVLDLDLTTPPADMTASNILVYLPDTALAEKVEAIAVPSRQRLA